MQSTTVTSAAESSAVQRWITRVQSQRLYRDIFEIGLSVVAFLLYFIVRGLVVDREGEALDNAQRIMRFERAIGIFWEPRLQEWVLPRQEWINVFNFIYFWLDFPLIVGIGFWLYFFRRHQYTIARDAILLSGAIALVIYNFFPVMPPRLLPTGEFVGTIEKYNQLSYQAQSLKAFVNPYAAVPSLHFGWAMIIGGALVVSVRNPLVRLFGLFLPWAQFAAIVFTANHYIVDAVAGMVVGLAGLALAAALQAWFYPALNRRFGVSALPP
ncbi:MAG: phosphatase PAP2 family protein [Chloroflexi bacterium]|nr:phosphatase PAP2 family protein [Chloroflexota bacterium]